MSHGEHMTDKRNAESQQITSRSGQVNSGQVKLEQLVTLGHMGSRHQLYSQRVKLAQVRSWVVRLGMLGLDGSHQDKKGHVGSFRLRQVKSGHIKLSQVMGQNRSGPVIYKVKSG